MRMLFVNLPVKNLEVSKRFFNGLGFPTNDQFTNEQAACIVVEENISVMLLTEPFFRTFITGPISDPAKGVEVLNCLSCDSRAEVDETLAKALAGGGAEWRPTQDLGFMYSAAFRDPDGHVWEIA
ncbi:MAG: VOC family protein, partial [Phenylobacterium sp.]